MGELKKEKFVCIDCEATGLDWEKDHIIEVAAVSFSLEKEFEVFDSLVDPQVEIPQESIEIHHISQEMVQGQPKIQEVLPRVLEIVGRNTIVGHGVSFDIHLINREAKKHNIPCLIRNNCVFDTLRMARLYGESPQNSLQKLRQHFNISDEGAHRALSDVIVNIEVFRKLAVRYKTAEQLQKILEKPILLKKMPLGKHKGRPLKEIPVDYLKWAAGKDFDQDLSFSIKSELKRRKQSKDFSGSSNPFSGL